jgi:hypothetical protein
MDAILQSRDNLSCFMFVSVIAFKFLSSTLLILKSSGIFTNRNLSCGGIDLTSQHELVEG